MLLDWKFLSGVWVAQTKAWNESWLIYKVSVEESEGMIMFSIKESSSELIGNLEDGYLCEPMYSSIDEARAALQNLETMWANEAAKDPAPTDDTEYATDDRAQFLTDPSQN